jgi:gamma-glutamyltranspeptidase
MYNIGLLGICVCDHILHEKLQVAMEVLWFNKNIKEAIDEPRLHHQLFPMRLQYEYGVLQVSASKVSLSTHY